MLVHRGSDNAGRHEREAGRINGFHHSVTGYSIYNYQPKKMIYLKIVAYMLGLTGTGWLLYFRVGGWKADALWFAMAGFWAVQFLRACMKLWFEYKTEQIELEAKRERYKRDIFS